MTIIRHNLGYQIDKRVQKEKEIRKRQAKIKYKSRDIMLISNFNLGLRIKEAFKKMVKSEMSRELLVMSIKMII
jgi:hypothetical protein